MVDPDGQADVSRRRFLTLLGAASAVPFVAGCTPERVGSTARVQPGGVANVRFAVASNGVRAQVTTPMPPVEWWARDVGLSTGDLPGGNPDHLLVLSYHNVTADGSRAGSYRSRPNPRGPDRYTVSAADLAAQLQMLSLAGFRSVRLQDLLDSRAGGPPLRPRSMLVTFDDGGAGQWIYADRVLAELGFSAVAFLITGHLGSGPACLSWQEAAALAGTGRWEIGAHTHDQHHFVPTGPLSPRASVLINRVWSPAAATLETAASARTRVEDDLATSLSLLGRHGFDRPRAFAYPFSQVNEPSNDAALPLRVSGMLQGTFPILMANTAPGRMGQPDDLREGLIPRLEVRGGTTALNLFDKVRSADVPAAFDHSTDGLFER